MSIEWLSNAWSNYLIKAKIKPIAFSVKYINLISLEKWEENLFGQLSISNQTTDRKSMDIPTPLQIVSPLMLL